MNIGAQWASPGGGSAFVNDMIRVWGTEGHEIDVASILCIVTAPGSYTHYVATGLSARIYLPVHGHGVFTQLSPKMKYFRF